MNKTDRTNKLIIKQRKKLTDLLTIKKEKINNIKSSIINDDNEIIKIWMDSNISKSFITEYIDNNIDIESNMIGEITDIGDSEKMLHVINKIISSANSINKIKACRETIENNSREIRHLELNIKNLIKQKDSIKHKHKNLLIKEEDILRKEDARIQIRLHQLNNDFFGTIYNFYSSIDNIVDLIKKDYQLLKNKDKLINQLNYNKIEDRYKNLNKIINLKKENKDLKQKEDSLNQQKKYFITQLDNINNIQNRFNYYKSIVLNSNCDLFNRHIDVYNLLKLDNLCLEENFDAKKDKLEYSSRLLSIKKGRLTKNLESIDRQIQIVNDNYNKQNNCPKKYYKQDITTLKDEKQEIFNNIESKISSIYNIYFNIANFIGSYYDNYDKYMFQKDRSIKRLKIMKSRFVKEEDNMIRDNKNTISDNKNKIKLLTKNIKECESDITHEYNINKVKNDYFNKLLLLYQQLDKINNDIKLVNDNIKYLQ